MTTQRKARTGLGRHRGFSSREPEQRCRAGAATSNHDTGCQLLCCFFLLIFAFYPTLFFLCLRTLLPPLTTDRRITPNLPDCPQPKVTDRYPLGRRVGHYDVPGAEGSGAVCGGAPERKARTSSRWVRAFSLFRAAGGKRYIVDQRKLAESGDGRGMLSIINLTRPASNLGRL